MDRTFVERNARDRARLAALVARLDDASLRRRLPNDWTVAAVLAHLAFWDRWVAARWDQYDRDGALQDLPDGITDLVNAAALPQWLALPPRQATELAVGAAEAVDGRIAALDAAAVAHAEATNRPAMLDRSLQRGPHLDEIERVVGSR